ncbi:MAG: hypothetical protein ABSF00_02930 [Candidatus Bathyarchaeia archaeon]
MTDLQVNVLKSIKQVSENGRYTIKGVSDPRSTKFGEAIVLTLLDSNGEERILFAPYSRDASDQSNLGRLVKAFTSNTALWIKRKIDIEIGPDKRRTVKPVAK